MVPGRNSSLKIAIVGAGLTGAYLYRLLTNAGCEVHLFDRPQNTRCGLTPCAWGTSADFPRLLQRAGLCPDDYLLARMESIVIDGVDIKAQMMTFDKPRLINDLLAGATICYGALPQTRYFRTIDATGVHRALLPPIHNDVVLNCCQYLVETDAPLESRIKIAGTGYAWCFPLSEKRYHMGCGSLQEDPRSVLKKMGWIDAKTADYPSRIVCGCLGNIRLTGPHHSLPFLFRNGNADIWGIGESIGCVAPMVGDGIVPGMRSVEILLDNWDNPAAYQEALLHEFRWMKDEREVVDALKRGAKVGIREARVLLKNSRRMNLRLGIREVVQLLRVLAANYLQSASSEGGEPLR